MQPQMQYYKPQCRKDGEIQAIGNKIPSFVWMLLLYATFGFSGLFITKMTMNSYISMFSDMLVGVDMTAFYWGTVAVVAFFEILMLYITISIYNFIAGWSTRGEIPCNTRELFKNLMPFFVIRNLILGGLSLLMFIPSGAFVSIGLMAFEPFATMLIFFPAFFAVKKRYIKQGYGKEILQAYAVPYIIFQVVFLIF